MNPKSTNKRVRSTLNKKKTPKISLQVPPDDYLTTLVRIAFARYRPPTNEEKVLEYIITYSKDDLRQFFNNIMDEDFCSAELSLTPDQINVAIKNLVITEVLCTTNHGNGDIYVSGEILKPFITYELCPEIQKLLKLGRKYIQKRTPPDGWLVCHE